MANGTTQPIDTVQVGQTVLATDPHTGQNAPEPVDAVVVHTGPHTLIDITVHANTPNGLQIGTVTATNGHPFWVTNPGHWINADQLTPNQQLHTPTNQSATILATHTHTATLAAYNLTVNTLHTYYVLAGGTPILVHNSGGTGARRSTSVREGQPSPLLADSGQRNPTHRPKLDPTAQIQ